MIAITGDLHCHNHHLFARNLEDGTNSRLQDIIDCLHSMAETAVERDCKTFIIAGDLFHSRKNIEHTVLERVCNAIRELPAFYRILLLAGNHDMSVTGDGSLSITALESTNVQVISTPSTQRIEGHTFGFIPYTEKEAEVDAVIEHFIEQEVEYIIGHLGILGGLVGPSDFEVPAKFSPEHLRPAEFKRIFLGHFHKHQWVVPERMMYIGSPLQLGWGERDEEKGFLIGDPETDEWDFMVNDKSPRFVMVEEEEDWDNVYKNDFVKVLVDEGEEVDERIKNGENIQMERRRIVKDAKARLNLAGKGDRDILKQYVEHVPQPGCKVPQKDLVEAGMELLKEATT